MPMKSSTKNDLGIFRNKKTDYFANNRNFGGLGNSQIPFPIDNIWGWYLSTEAYSDSNFNSKVTTSSSKVYGLKDLSDMNNHLIQPNGGLQPVFMDQFIASGYYGINGNPTIQYYGGLTHLTTLNVPSELSMYLVAKTDLNTTSNSWSHISTQVYFNFSLFSFPTEPLRLISNGGQVEVQPSPTPLETDPFLASWHFNDSTVG